MTEIVIKGGILIDGTGGPPRTLRAQVSDLWEDRVQVISQDILVDQRDP